MREYSLFNPFASHAHLVVNSLTVGFSFNPLFN